VNRAAKTPAAVSLRELFATVFSGGYCIGCGACSLGRRDYPVTMELDEFGCFRPRVIAGGDADAAWDLPTVCPFSAAAEGEDALAEPRFAESCGYHPKIGYYAANYAGYVAEGGFRRQGSSGGMGSWILCELLRRGLVDAVVHVQPREPSPDDGRLFAYAVSRTPEQVAAGAKSRYYPVEMSGVLRFVRENPGRYAAMGVPCFAKALRLLGRHDPLFAQRVQFCVALFCGHLKSTAFAELFSWQCGIKPGDLLAIDFRKKLPGRRASQYGVELKGRSEGAVAVRDAAVDELYGTDWGLGFFKYHACDWCDDVVGETADVSVGDAWLPQYTPDSRGTNVVIARNAVIRQIIEEARSQGRLVLDDLGPDEMAASQRGGFRHRRDGLAYRLHLAEKTGRWHPPKRVPPDACRHDRRFRRIQELRSRLARESHVAWKAAVEAGDFRVFVRRLDPLVRAYRACYVTPRFRQVLDALRSFAGRAKGFLLRRLRRALARIGAGGDVAAHEGARGNGGKETDE
jgi:coenzyme F420 hydrogenase subunit beta